jgi:hypothetical protein
MSSCSLRGRPAEDVIPVSSAGTQRQALLRETKASVQPRIGWDGTGDQLRAFHTWLLVPATAIAPTS